MTTSAHRRFLQFPWSTISANTNGVRNRGYRITNTSELLLPTDRIDGDFLYVKAFANGAKITQSLATDRIYTPGGVVTTLGATGYIEFLDDYIDILIYFYASDNTWHTFGTPSGTIDVV